MYGIPNTGAVTADIFITSTLWRHMAIENCAKNNTKLTDSALTRLPLAVYARFKSVNFFNTTNKKIQFWWGPYWWRPGAMAPLDPLNPALEVRVSRLT